MASKGTIVFLDAFGASICALAIVLKLVLGHDFRSLSAGEFIAIFGFGVVLILMGAGYSIYVYHREMDIFAELMKGEEARKNVVAEIGKSGMQALGELGSSVGEVVGKAIDGQTTEKPITFPQPR